MTYTNRLQPPKLTEKINPITILKFKRHKVTYMVTVDLSTKTGKSVKSFQALLSNMVNHTGGLQKNEVEDIPMDEDNIEVPKSEFLDDENEDIEVPESEFASNIDEKSMIVDKQIRLAIPKDKTQPYINEWVELQDSILVDIQFNDYDILAFAIDDENFEIIESAYEE